MIPVEEAQARVLALCPRLGPEQVPLAEAAGRVLAADMVARRDQPPFAASAMDGYALSAADARPGAVLRVTAESAAGHATAARIGRGAACRIFTGAPVPEGCDTVVIQEDVAAQDGTIRLAVAAAPGDNIRPAGGDFRAGDRVAAPRRLRPADLALAAAMNLPALTCAARPEVAIIATGDELEMPGAAPRPDQIIASNLFALKAMAEAEGARVRLLPIARDRDSSLRAVLDLARGADLIVTIGGASVGDHDIVGRVAAELGLDRAFWKIAMRPGKPLMAGRMGAALMLGLPGNPVSAIVCGHLFLLPALRAMQGLPDPLPRPLRAVLAAPVAANAARAHYMRARLVDTADGLPRIAPFERQDSALLSVLTEAQALLIRPPLAPAGAEGEPALYLPL